MLAKLTTTTDTNAIPTENIAGVPDLLRWAGVSDMYCCMANIMEVQPSILLRVNICDGSLVSGHRTGGVEDWLNRTYGCHWEGR